MCRTTKSRAIPTSGNSLPQFGHPNAPWENEFELPCIFPFYYREKLYTSCALLDIGDYNTPVYRFPVFNTTKKKNGINHFEQDYRVNGGGIVSRGIRKYCLDQKLAETTCGVNLETELRKLPNSPCRLTVDHTSKVELYTEPDCGNDAAVEPFATCKSDCPGGEINSSL